jgi:DNA (cytosine-5)-methyltransferase 1
MKFGSVCSGIEAASVAWHPLGWQAAWLSEIEPFPSAVLAHHYPDVPNLGDMTLLPERILSGEIEAPDVFCGGTPCQAFSVAGLRNSLDDARGNLSLTFVGIANAIDHVRVRAGKPASIVFWENVPGVLSTKDNAFGCFLGALAGEDGELEPAGGKWTNAGCVFGPTRAVAWRVLDAQYFGLAQRRRRVFVVSSARDDFDPVKVLFEFDGVRRDIAPSREAGEGIAHATAPCLTSSGRGVERTGETRGQDPVVAVATLCVATGQAGAEIGAEIAPTLNCNHEAPYFMYQTAHTLRDEVRMMHVAGALAAEPEAKQQTYVAIPIHDMATRHAGTDGSGNQNGKGHGLGIGGESDPMFTLTKGDKHAVAQPYTLAIRGRGGFHNLEYRQDGTANALLTPNGGRGGIGVGAVAQPIGCFKGGQGSAAGGIGYDEHIAPTLSAADSGSNRTPALMLGMAVRRLTPVECERLQGFPDGYTAIPWRKKPASECPDGPRYKALGNSWAVPVVAWIGKRIQNKILKGG